MERTPLDAQLFHPAEEILLQAVRAENYRLAFLVDSWRSVILGRSYITELTIDT